MRPKSDPLHPHWPVGDPSIFRALVRKLEYGPRLRLTGLKDWELGIGSCAITFNRFERLGIGNWIVRAPFTNYFNFRISVGGNIHGPGLVPIL